MNPRSASVVFLVVLIVATGILRSHVSEFYSSIISWSLQLVNLDYNLLEVKIGFFAKDGTANHGLGIFLYFATYLILHLCLIHFLFLNSIKLRKYLSVGLICLIIGLGIMTVILKYVGTETLALIPRKYFNELVGRPLILFIVEGGGLIYEYVDKHSSH